jgi:preprotein translocase subunit SecG
MSMLETLLLVVHLMVAAAVCGFVLLQHGKGADMGAAFGSGASGSLFGAVGSANFLSRTTAILATVFFLSSLGLTWFATTRTGPKSVIQQGVMETMPAPKASDVPAAPAGAGAAPAGSVEPAKAPAPSATGAAPAGSVEPAKAPAPADVPAAPVSAPAVNPAAPK